MSKYLVMPSTFTASKRHLADVSMGYFEHMAWALKTAFFLIVHAFVPSKFTHTASNRLCSKQSTSQELPNGTLTVETLHENPDGSATITVDMSEEHRLAFFRLGLIQAIKDGIEAAKPLDPEYTKTYQPEWPFPRPYKDTEHDQ